MKGTVKMWIKATLRNARRPDYAVVTIPFPIPTDQYDSTIKMLEALDIGDPLVRDCKAEEIHGKASVLKCLEERTVNVDELDYLAKRLYSFTLSTEDQKRMSLAAEAYVRAMLERDFRTLDFYKSLRGTISTAESVKNKN